MFVDELDAVPDGATVVFSAHGVSPTVRTEAVDRELETIAQESALVPRRSSGHGET